MLERLLGSWINLAPAVALGVWIAPGMRLREHKKH